MEELRSLATFEVQDTELSSAEDFLSLDTTRPTQLQTTGPGVSLNTQSLPC